MTTGVPFLQPRLVGPRFEGGVIPLEVLGDLAVLAEMVVEVAKWKYRKDHPNRRRVPRGFTDGVSLKLTRVQEGSAKPLIELFAVATSALFPTDAQTYFEAAREDIIEAVAAADEGRRITSLPPKLLGYFDRFGRNLIAGEAIELSEGRVGKPARLTRETRQTLVLASAAEEVTNEVVVYGTIPELDQQASTFHVQLADGTKLKAHVTPQHSDALMEAFVGYRHGTRTRVHATGVFSRANRLQELVAVEHVLVLDPLDIGARVDELKLLKRGWLDGKGLPPDPGLLEWVATSFDSRYPDELPLPHLYPTPEGGVRAEWTVGGIEASFELSPEHRRGRWHAVDLNDDQEQSEELDLNTVVGWDRLTGLLRAAGGAG